MHLTYTVVKAFMIN